MKTKFSHIILGVFLFWILTGCEGNYISSIPIVPVFIELHLATDPTFKENPYQFRVFEQRRAEHEAVGFGGILVICGFGSSNIFEYYAYDLACPYEAKANIKVTPNEIGQAVCETCGSVYEIIHGIGNPIEGPAKEILKRYKTTLINSPTGEILRITHK